MIRAVCFALAIAACPAESAASDGDAAEAAARALTRAGMLLAETEGARNKVEALTETVRAYEDGLAALRVGLRQAHVSQTRIEGDLGMAEAELSRLVGALLSVESAPDSVSLLHPSGPLSNARAAMLIGDVLPSLDARARALRDELEELARLRELQQGAEDVLRDGLKGVQAARTSLSQAITERRPGRHIAGTDAATMQALLNSADTLDGFASSLATLNAGPDQAPDPVSANGALALPANARVIGRFGETGASGTKSSGLSLALPARTLVTAPHSATLRYAGPLLDLGEVAILEPESGTLFVYAGLGRALGQQGDILEKGAPLGFMGGSPHDADQILIETAAGSGHDRPETLYIEIRQGQELRDPGAWFDLTEAQD